MKPLDALLPALIAIAVPAAAEPARHALVIGNADYRNLTPLRNTVNDAADMAATLGKLGFSIDRASDTSLAAFEKDLAAFAAGVRPGDVAIVYYAGHGVTGRTGTDASQTDSFLLPVDIALAAPADVPQRARGLGAILAALDRAQAGTKLIILDACRDNPFASVWPADEPGAAGGLVQPVTDTLRGAVVAYATSPGEPAIENSAGRNGLFTQELLKRIGTPDTSVSAILADVSAAVEYESKGEQIPFFVAGDPEAAAYVLNRSAANAPVFADPLAVDLKLRREAMDCGLAACLESAGVEMRDPGLQQGMVAMVKSLRGAGSPRSTAPVAAASLPAIDAGLPPAAAAFVAAEKGTAGGVLMIGRQFMLGSKGFPRRPATAIEWYKVAAAAGSGSAAYEIASALHNGLSGIAKNRVEAYRWLLKAAKANHPPAYSLGGRYRLEGWGAQLKNLPAAKRWFEAGVALGDPASMVQLAKLTDDLTESARLWRLAADKGMPEAIFHDALAMEGTAPDFRGITSKEMLLKIKQAGDLGYWGAYTRLGYIFRTGNASVAPDRAEAIRWFGIGAERGDPFAMYSLGLAYGEAAPGVATDCRAAELWIRRAATAGEWRAIELTRGAFTCPFQRTPVKK